MSVRRSDHLHVADHWRQTLLWISEESVIQPGETGWFSPWYLLLNLLVCLGSRGHVYLLVFTEIQWHHILKCQQPTLGLRSWGWKQLKGATVNLNVRKGSEETQRSGDHPCSWPPCTRAFISSPQENILQKKQSIHGESRNMPSVTPSVRGQSRIQL